MAQLAVIIPVYSQDSDVFLKASIDSLLEQSFTNFDLYILIDGPINERLRDVINSYSRPDYHIIPFEENRGLPAVLNSGIDICRKKEFDFIARMDADDRSHPERLEKQLDYMNTHPEVDMLGTQAFLIDNNNNIIGEKIVKLTTNFEQLLRRIDVIHPSTMFRTVFFEKYGYYNPYYKNSQDMDLWLRATKKGAVIHSLKDKLYYLRFDKDVIKRRKRGQFYRIKIKKQHLSGLKYLISIVPNISVIICPAFILRIILKIKTNVNRSSASDEN